MGVIETKAFKSGNSVAVRLPKEFGIREGDELLLGRTATGATISVKPRKSMAELARRLREIGTPPGGKQEREPIEFPERPGL